MSTRKKIDLVILVIVLLSGVIALKNAVALGDWWHARRYTPPADIAQLADDAGMSSEGRKLFYRLSPRFVSNAELQTACPDAKLGCVEGRNLYILEDDGSVPEHNRSVVTAAHEMLHMAYSRLTEDEKARLEPLLRAELEAADTRAINSKLATYPAADYINEAHSFIGSEKADLAAELETHFKRYFSNRQKLIDAYQNSSRFN